MSEQWKRFVDILRSLWISGVTGLFFIRLWRTDTARWRREPCNPSKKNISGSTPAPYSDLNRVTLVRWLTPLHIIDIYMTTLQLVTWERACVAPWPDLGVTLTMTLTLNNAQWSSVVQELEVRVPRHHADHCCCQRCVGAGAVSQSVWWHTALAVDRCAAAITHRPSVLSPLPTHRLHCYCLVTSVDVDSKARFGAIKFSKNSVSLLFTSLLHI